MNFYHLNFYQFIPPNICTISTALLYTNNISYARHFATGVWSISVVLFFLHLRGLQKQQVNNPFSNLYHLQGR